MIDLPAPPDGGAALVARVCRQHDFTPVMPDTLEAFSAGWDVVLLLCDEPTRSPETSDLAVVLPEMLKGMPGLFRPGIANAADSRQIADQYAIVNLPALLFLRDGAWVGAIEGLRNWAEFVTAVRAMKDAPAGRRPGIGIPVRGAAGAGCH